MQQNSEIKNHGLNWYFRKHFWLKVVVHLTKVKDWSHFGWFYYPKWGLALNYFQFLKAHPHKYQKWLDSTVIVGYQLHFILCPWLRELQPIAGHSQPINLVFVHTQSISLSLMIPIFSIMIIHFDSILFCLYSVAPLLIWAYTTFPSKRILYSHSSQFPFPSTPLSFLEYSSPK